MKSFFYKLFTGLNKVHSFYNLSSYEHCILPINVPFPGTDLTFCKTTLEVYSKRVSYCSYTELIYQVGLKLNKSQHIWVHRVSSDNVGQNLYTFTMRPFT